MRSWPFSTILKAFCNGKVISMNSREKRFCQEYVKGETATSAAINAGYSPKTAASQGSRLLRKSNIQQYIKQLQDAADSEAIAKTKEVKKVFTSLLRGHYPANVKIRAGEALVKMDTEKTQEEHTEDQTEDQAEREQFIKIYMPYSSRMKVEDINAVKWPDGTITPLSGHEKDDLLFYYDIKPENDSKYELEEHAN